MIGSDVELKVNTRCTVVPVVDPVLFRGEVDVLWIDDTELEERGDQVDSILDSFGFVPVAVLFEAGADKELSSDGMVGQVV